MRMPTAEEMEAIERKQNIHKSIYDIVSDWSREMRRNKSQLVDELCEYVIEEIQSE